MNVLFLTKYDVLRGGVAQALSGLQAALEGVGVGVIVCSSDVSAANSPLPSGAVCVRAPLPKPGLWGGRGAIDRLGEICREHAIDVVHCHGLYRPGYAGRLLKGRLGIPYVATSHGDIVGSSRMRRRSVRGRCERILRDADAVVMLTQALADEAVAICPARTDVEIIPGGIDVGYWQRERDRPKRGHVFSLGRMDRQKGFDVLIQAAGELSRRGRPAPLVIAGEGATEDELKNQARQLGLTVHDDTDAMLESGGVCFPGYIDGAEKVRLMAEAEVFAFPSAYGEGFGLVMLEAMAAGTAVLASDLPTLGWLLRPGENCDTAAAGDADAWADALEALLADDARRRRYREAGFRDVGGYDLSLAAERYKAVYERVARPRG